MQRHLADQAFYATLKRQSQFAIYYRLLSAKRIDTRQKRMAEMPAKLACGESPLDLRLANDQIEPIKSEIEKFISH